MNGNIVRNLLIVFLTEIDSPAVSSKTVPGKRELSRAFSDPSNLLRSSALDDRVDGRRHQFVVYH